MNKPLISPLQGVAAVLLLGAACAAQAGPDVESLGGVEDGPHLSATVSNFIEQGYSSKGSAAGASDTALSYGVETPDGEVHFIVMDPISGDVSASH